MVPLHLLAHHTLELATGAKAHHTLEIAASVTVLVPIGTRCRACTQLPSYVTKLIIQQLVITRTILFHPLI